MSTYRIDITRTEFLHCYVEAESSDAALNAYYDLDCELTWVESETQDITATLAGGDSTGSDNSV